MRAIRKMLKGHKRGPSVIEYQNELNETLINQLEKKQESLIISEPKKFEEFKDKEVASLQQKIAVESANFEKKELEEEQQLTEIKEQAKQSLFKVDRFIFSLATFSNEVLFTAENCEAAIKLVTKISQFCAKQVIDQKDQIIDPKDQGKLEEIQVKLSEFKKYLEKENKEKENKEKEIKQFEFNLYMGYFYRQLERVVSKLSRNIQNHVYNCEKKKKNNITAAKNLRDSNIKKMTKNLKLTEALKTKTKIINRNKKSTAIKKLKMGIIVDAGHPIVSASPKSRESSEVKLTPLSLLNSTNKEVELPHTVNLSPAVLQSNLPSDGLCAVPRRRRIKSTLPPSRSDSSQRFSNTPSDQEIKPLPKPRRQRSNLPRYDDSAVPPAFSTGLSENILGRLTAKRKLPNIARLPRVPEVKANANHHKKFPSTIMVASHERAIHRRNVSYMTPTKSFLQKKNSSLYHRRNLSLAIDSQRSNHTRSKSVATLTVRNLSLQTDQLSNQSRSSGKNNLSVPTDPRHMRSKSR